MRSIQPLGINSARNNRDALRGNAAIRHHPFYTFGNGDEPNARMQILRPAGDRIMHLGEARNPRGA